MLHYLIPGSVVIHLVEATDFTRHYYVYSHVINFTLPPPPLYSPYISPHISPHTSPHTPLFHHFFFITLLFHHSFFIIPLFHHFPPLYSLFYLPSFSTPPFHLPFSTLSPPLSRRPPDTFPHSPPKASHVARGKGEGLLSWFPLIIALREISI